MQESTMDFTTYLIIMGAVLLFCLLAIGLILGRPRSSDKPAARGAAPPVPAAPSRVMIAQAEEGGPFVWVVGGRPHASLDEIDDEEQRQRVEHFLAELRDWLGLPGAEAPPPAGSRTRVPGPRPRPVGYEEEMRRPLFDRLRASFIEEGAARAVAPPPSSATSAFQPSDKIVKLDGYFQEVLLRRGVSAMAQVRSRPTGAVEIVVDGQTYRSVNEVPDEAVRDALREAVSRWEDQGLR